MMRLRSAWLASQPRQRLLFSLAAGLVVLGLVLTNSSRARAATNWMFIFHPSDFGGSRELGSFLWNLQVPIPPVIATAGILSYQLTGDTSLVTHLVYRASMIANFVLALLLAGSSGIRRPIAVFALSWVLLWGTVLVHPGNPQVYDVLYCTFILLFVLLVTRAGRPSLGARQRPVLAAGAGFFLSLAELARPFVLLILPLLVLCSWQALGPSAQRRRLFVWFLVPLLLLSGSWHVHQAVHHGQIVWSNHSGVNLVRAWPMVAPPEKIAEPHDEPLAPGRWANLNTAEHRENSRRLRRAVLHYAITHPVDSARHAMSRTVTLLSAPTDLYRNHPRHALLGLYRPLVWLASVLFLVGAVRLIALVARSLIRREGRWRELLGTPDSMLIVAGMGTIFFLALGEAKEEPRSVVSVLPFLAALPLLPAGHGSLPARDRHRDEPSRSSPLRKVATASTETSRKRTRRQRQRSSRSQFAEYLNRLSSSRLPRGDAEAPGLLLTFVALRRSIAAIGRYPVKGAQGELSWLVKSVRIAVAVQCMAVPPAELVIRLESVKPAEAMVR